MKLIYVNIKTFLLLLATFVVLLAALLLYVSGGKSLTSGKITA